MCDPTSPSQVDGNKIFKLPDFPFKYVLTVRRGSEGEVRDGWRVSEVEPDLQLMLMSELASGGSRG